MGPSAVDSGMIVVETSATEQHRTARVFYAGLGYGEQARIRDHWADGDDLVVFRRLLDRPART